MSGGGIASEAALGAAAGLVLGVVHFRALRRNAELYLDGRGPWRAAAVQVGRFCLLALGLWALARIGAPALLGGALGLLAGRRVALGRLRERRG